MDTAAFAKDFMRTFTEVSDNVSPSFVENVKGIVDSGDFWEAANAIGAYFNEHEVSEEVKRKCVCLIEKIRDFQGKRAQISSQTTTVVFGTSGWRGIIGEDFTVLNVHKVISGIVKMMKEKIFLDFNGYASFEEVQKNGIVVFRDNRYMGDAFMDAAMNELAAEGVKCLLAGECPTGVGSALVCELGAAGSINFTPSHNPMAYAGLKFNPADGGPAGSELTSVIESYANALMQPDAEFTPSDVDYTSLKQDLDAAGMFRTFVETKSKVFDMDKLRTWLGEVRKDLFILVDNMHGSSRGYIERLLGEKLITELAACGSIQFVNTNDDYSFHGVKPEPSAKNQAHLIAMLKESGRNLTLAVALDPDADRIRFADADMDIDMNRFGALAYANLLLKGIDGGVATTVASTDFGLEIAKREGKETFETAVGFKNFREPLKREKSVIAFEESDGISFVGHTLEKCALGGFLAAVDAMATSGKNLSVQFQEIQEKYGYFYPEKAGADVKGVSVEEWQTYKQEVVETLQSMYKKGDSVVVGGKDMDIVDVLTDDGAKVVFADKSWILLRPSGTEPKFRYYYELASESPIDDVDGALKKYREAAAHILEKARAIVDTK